MPEEDYVWLPHESVLSFEETARLVDVFLELGVDKVRLTGGEPLLRRDLTHFIAMLSAKPGLNDLAMTTNGVLLAKHAQALKDAGLHRLTVSLDTLDGNTFRLLARRDALEEVLRGLDAAEAAGFTNTKIDTVLMRGVNDGEILDLLAMGAQRGIEVRFIEYMDVGGATNWSMDRVVPQAEVLRTVAAHHGEVTALPKIDSAPADQFRAADGTSFGVIASTTVPFCATCDRSRLTADGRLFTCLYARDGLDLREPVRSGMDTAALRALLTKHWRTRIDAGAEERIALAERRDPLAKREQLRDDPHLEMHTRGG